MYTCSCEQDHGHQIEISNDEDSADRPPEPALDRLYLLDGLRGLGLEYIKGDEEGLMSMQMLGATTAGLLKEINA
ncbi:MAG: hypothetical protein ABFC89_03905 [Methanospirillum sp.]